MKKRIFPTFKLPVNPKIILGVDVGLQNMAYCAIDNKRGVLSSQMVLHTIMNLKPYRTQVGPKNNQRWSEDLDTELEIHRAQIHCLLDEIKPDLLVMERFMTRRDRKRTLEVLKVKITHTVDVVVMERNTGAPGSMNATLGLYRDGELVQVGGCSMIGKPDLQPGDVGEVEFLYVPDPANPSLYQPRLVRARPDKEPTACTWEQLRGKAANRSVITAEEPTMTTATIPAIQITVTSHQAKLAQSIGLEVAGGCIVVEPDDVTNVARELEAKMALQPRGKRGPWKAILERIIATGLVADNPTTIPEVESGEPSAPEIVSIVETPAGPTVVTDDGVVVDMTVIDVVESNHPNRPVVLRPAEGRAARFMGWDSAENWARELVTSGQQAQVVVTDELSGRQGTFRKAS